VMLVKLKQLQNAQLPMWMTDFVMLFPSLSKKCICPSSVTMTFIIDDIECSLTNLDLSSDMSSLIFSSYGLIRLIL